MNARAMTLGCIGRPGAPHRASDMDPEHYIFMIDGMLRDAPDADVTAIDALYAPRSSHHVVTGTDDRAATIAAFLRDVDG